jgi:DNA-binding GntR family transcriptional regulator
MNWSEFITADLRAKIQQRQNMPLKFTLTKLAQIYDVSIAPVRVSVKKLISEGLLIKRQNGRLELKKRIESEVGFVTGPLPEFPADSYDVIARDLVVSSLKGQPVFLREVNIAKRYKIGRSRVRRILGRLSGEGIVDHIPRRGWRLRPFNQADLDSFLEIREVLELKAIDLAIGKLDKKDLQEILSGNISPQASEYLKVDNTLHRYIIEKSQNRYIRDFFEHYGKYYEILFEWEDYDLDSAIMAVRHHRAIIKALLRGDRKAAKKAMADHIRNNHTFLKGVNPAKIRVTEQRIVVKN